VFSEARRFIEHNLLKGQEKMFGFIAKLCNLTMIGLVKAFLTKTATVTVSQSVLTTAAKMRNAGWDLGNAGKTRKILDHTIWH